MIFASVPSSPLRTLEVVIKNKFRGRSENKNTQILHCWSSLHGSANLLCSSLVIFKCFFTFSFYDGHSYILKLKIFHTIYLTYSDNALDKYTTRHISKFSSFFLLMSSTCNWIMSLCNFHLSLLFQVN